jgi:hypothetical protein
VVVHFLKTGRFIRMMVSRIPVVYGIYALEIHSQDNFLVTKCSLTTFQFVYILTSAWFMAEGECEDQKKENRQEPNKPATVVDLKSLGISYWKMDADSFEYPVKAVPWDPMDAVDPHLKALRDDRGYSYADIISIRPDLCECTRRWNLLYSL